METRDLKATLEALVFAAEEPLGLAALTGILEEGGAERAQIQQALQELLQEYNENNGRGLLLREVGGAYQFVTQPRLASFVQKLNADKPKTLSQAALETLAIVAYRQPVVRSEIEQIRGVDSGGVLKTLLERGFIRIVGRKEEAGQPLIYGTTPAFLELFHLTNLEELPSMREVEQIVDEQNQKGSEPPAAAVTGATEEDELETGTTPFPAAESVAEDQALADLDSSLKTLRRLEKEIFPKEVKPENNQPEVENTPVSNLEEKDL